MQVAALLVNSPAGCSWQGGAFPSQSQPGPVHWQNQHFPLQNTAAVKLCDNTKKVSNNFNFWVFGAGTFFTCVYDFDFHSRASPLLLSLVVSFQQGYSFLIPSKDLRWRLLVLIIKNLYFSSCICVVVIVFVYFLVHLYSGACLCVLPPVLFHVLVSVSLQPPTSHDSSRLRRRLTA